MSLSSDSIPTSLEDIQIALNAEVTAQEIQAVLQDELERVEDVVRYIVTLLAQHQVYLGHGTDNYWDEAIEIVQAVMHIAPSSAESTLGCKLTLKERKIIASILELRIFERIPSPYLTNRAFFCNHQFYVDKRVIIPRSPLSELIEAGFDPYLDRTPDRVLDMCTGSGCIAIAIALQFNGECEVDAVDISDDALEVCNINIEGYGLEDIVTPIKSDLFSALPEGDKYDLIVANPPYVDAYDLATMPEEYQHEPALALGSGDDGLDAAIRILQQAHKFLADDGILIMEVGNSQEHLIAAFPQVPFHFVDLKRGGHGVFMLTHDQLEAFAEIFNR